MSEHKTGKSNWTPQQKKEYQDRRNHGLRGQTGAVTAHRRVVDDKGKEQLVPLGAGKGSNRGLMGKRQGRRQEWREARTEDRRQNRANARQAKRALSGYQRQDSSRGQGREG